MDEVISRRTANSKHFALGSGRYRAEIYSIPVHYKDNYDSKIELWKDIDCTWRNGRIDTAPYIAEIDGLTLRFTDKETGESGTIALEKIGNTIVDAKSQLSFEGRLATIKDFSIDLDLCIEAHPSGVKFSRIAKSDKAITEAQFDIKGNLMRIKSQGYDADGKALQLTASTKDGKLTESLSSLQVVDMVGVSKAAKYPLRIDPTVTIQPSSKDNRINSAAPSANYGGETNIYVTALSTDINRVLLEYDVTTLSGLNLTSASLQLFYYYYNVNPVGRTIQIYRCRRVGDDAWVENQATWEVYKTGSSWGTGGAANTSTDIDTSLGASTTVPASFGWMSWDVLDLTNDAITNRGNILSCRLHDPGTSYYRMTMWYSSEYTTDTTRCPKLVVEYTMPNTKALGIAYSKAIIQVIKTIFPKAQVTAYSHLGNKTYTITPRARVIASISISIQQALIMNSKANVIVEASPAIQMGIILSPRSQVSVSENVVPGSTIILSPKAEVLAYENIIMQLQIALSPRALATVYEREVVRQALSIYALANAEALEHAELSASFALSPRALATASEQAIKPTAIVLLTPTARGTVTSTILLNFTSSLYPQALVHADSRDAINWQTTLYAIGLVQALEKGLAGQIFVITPSSEAMATATAGKMTAYQIATLARAIVYASEQSWILGETYSKRAVDLLALKKHARFRI